MHVEVDDSSARVILRKIEARGKNLSGPMDRIATALRNSVQENFRVGGRFSQEGSIRGGQRKWDPVKNIPTLRSGHEKGKTLLRSGLLMRSITPESSATSAHVSSGLVYARIQNNGGKTKPHEIKARNGKALAFMKGGKNILCRSVHHPGSTIIARTFMVIQQEDISYAMETIADHLTR